MGVSSSTPHCSILCSLETRNNWSLALWWVNNGWGEIEIVWGGLGGLYLCGWLDGLKGCDELVGNGNLVERVIWSVVKFGW